MKQKILILCLPLLLGFLSVSAQEKAPYRIYDSKGKASTYNEMLSTTSEADVVLFGEQHNNAVAHWFEIELAKDLFQTKGNNLMLGAEMFEADEQLILDEFVNGTITEKNFLEQARLWPNYATDYAPLVNFARNSKIRFVATNIPRRYASMVSKGGFEVLGDLSEEAKKYIAPLPVEYDSELSCYKSLLTMGGMGMGQGNANPNFPKAQAIKDATMAYFIIKNLQPETIFLHYNGAYHSDNYESIVWYLNKSDKKLKIITISTVEQSDINVLSNDYKGLADFIIVVDEDFTKTY
ncbi:MAG TPA: ChaN family lipoprotein [Bacteroidales bacterium]|nr:ChaN family lipoprotein [Bacteroidales bacterium]HQP04794.1 ChaN family lipoprotein [Bacteroidales bacterium]